MIGAVSRSDGFEPHDISPEHFTTTNPIYTYFSGAPEMSIIYDIKVETYEPTIQVSELSLQNTLHNSTISTLNIKSYALKITPKNPPASSKKILVLPGVQNLAPPHIMDSGTQKFSDVVINSLLLLASTSRHTIYYTESYGYGHNLVTDLTLPNLGEVDPWLSRALEIMGIKPTDSVDVVALSAGSLSFQNLIGPYARFSVNTLVLGAPALISPDDNSSFLRLYQNVHNDPSISDNAHDFISGLISSLSQDQNYTDTAEATIKTQLLLSTMGGLLSNSNELLRKDIQTQLRTGSTYNEFVTSSVEDLFNNVPMPPPSTVMSTFEFNNDYYHSTEIGKVVVIHDPTDKITLYHNSEMLTDNLDGETTASIIPVSGQLSDDAMLMVCYGHYCIRVSRC